MKKLLLLLCLLMTGIASALAQVTLTEQYASYNYDDTSVYSYALSNFIWSAAQEKWSSLNGSNKAAVEANAQVTNFTVNSHTAGITSTTIQGAGSPLAADNILKIGINGHLGTDQSVTVSFTITWPDSGSGSEGMGAAKGQTLNVTLTGSVSPNWKSNPLAWKSSIPTQYFDKGSTYSVNLNDFLSNTGSSGTKTFGFGGGAPASGFAWNGAGEPNISASTFTVGEPGQMQFTVKQAAVWATGGQQYKAVSAITSPTVTFKYNNELADKTIPTIGSGKSYTFSTSSTKGSTGTITYSTSSPKITYSGGKINVASDTPAGTYTITAEQEETEAYGSASKTYSFEVKALADCDLAMKPGQSTTIRPYWKDILNGNKINLKDYVNVHSDAYLVFSPAQGNGSMTNTTTEVYCSSSRPTAGATGMYADAEGNYFIAGPLYCNSDVCKHGSISISVYPKRDINDLAAQYPNVTKKVSEMASYDPLANKTGSISALSDKAVTYSYWQGSTNLGTTAPITPGTYTVKLEQAQAFTIEEGSASYTLTVQSDEVACNLALTADTDTKTYADVKAGVNLASYIAPTSHAPSSVTFSTENANYEVVGGKLKIKESATTLGGPVVVKFTCPAVPGYEAGEATLTLTVNKVPNTLTATTPLNITVDQAIAGYDVKTNSGVTSTAGSNGGYAYSITPSDADSWVTPEGELHGKANETYVVSVHQYGTAFYEEAIIDITVNVGDKHDCDLNVATKSYTVHYSDVKPSGSGFAIDGTLTRHDAVDPVVLSVPGSSIVEVVGGKIKLKSSATALGSEPLTATCPEDDKHKAGTNSISFTILKDENVINATDQSISVAEALAGYNFVSGCGVENTGTENTNAIIYTTDNGTISGNTITGLVSGETATITATQATTNFVDGATKTFTVTVGAKDANNLAAGADVTKKVLTELPSFDPATNVTGGNSQPLTVTYQKGSETPTSTKPTAVGEYKVIISQSETATVLGKTVQYTMTVVTEADVISATDLSEFVTATESGYTLTGANVTRNSTGALTFSGTGVSGTTFTMATPGNYTITVNSAADAYYNASSTTFNFEVKPISGTLTIANVTKKISEIKTGYTLEDSKITTPSAGAITYSCSNTDMSIDDNKFTCSKEGTYTINATQAAAGAYESMNTTFTITVVKDNSDATVDPSSDSDITSSETSDPTNQVFNITKTVDQVKSGYSLADLCNNAAGVTYTLTSNANGKGALTSAGVFSATEKGSYQAKAHKDATATQNAYTATFNITVVANDDSSDPVKGDPSYSDPSDPTNPNKVYVEKTIDQVKDANYLDLATLLSGSHKDGIVYAFTSNPGSKGSLSSVTHFQATEVGTYVISATRGTEVYSNPVNVQITVKVNPMSETVPTKPGVDLSKEQVIKLNVAKTTGFDLNTLFTVPVEGTITTDVAGAASSCTGSVFKTDKIGKYVVSASDGVHTNATVKITVIKDNDDSDPDQPHAKPGADTTTEPGTPTDPIVDPGKNGKDPVVTVVTHPGGTPVTPWPYTGGGTGGSVTPPSTTPPGEYKVTITYPVDPENFIPETTVGPFIILVKSANANLTIANQTIEKGQTADLSSSAYTSNNHSTPVFYRNNGGSWEAITSAETASLAIGTYSMKVSLPNYVSGSDAIPAIEKEFTLEVTRKTADIDIPVDPSDPSIKKTDTNEWTVTKKLSEMASGFDVSSVVTGTDASHLTYILHSGTGTLAGTLYETTEVGEAQITATWAGDTETNAFNGEIIIKVVSDENVKVEVTPGTDPTVFPTVKEEPAGSGKYTITIQLSQASSFDLCSVLSGDQKNDVAFTTSAAGCSISGARYFSTSSVGTYLTHGHLDASGVYPAFDADVTVIVVKNSSDPSAPHETGTEDPDGKKPGDDIMEPFVTPGDNKQPPVITITPIDPSGTPITITVPGTYPTDKPVVPTTGPGSTPGKYQVEIEIPTDPTTHTPGGKFGPYTYVIGNPDATFSAPDQYIKKGEAGNFTKTAYTSANEKTPTFYVKNGSTWTPITSAASLDESTTPYEIQVVLPVDDVNIVEAHEFRPSATSGDFKLYVGHENPADKKKDEVNIARPQLPYDVLDNIDPKPTDPSVISGITYEKKPKGGDDSEYTPFAGPNLPDTTPDGDYTIRITIPADPSGPTPKKVIVYDIHVGPEFHYGGDTTQPELESIDGETLDVEMDRTFIAGWNTICLPFSLSDSEIYSVFGSGAQVWEFSRATTDMIMHFTKQDDLVEMLAGVPYMIYLPTAVVNPTFSGVTIETSVGQTVTQKDVNNDEYKFTGAVTATAMGTGNGLRMLSGTSIKKPSSAGTLKASRCYYQFPASAGAKSGMMMFMNFNETTGIEADATVSESENQVIYTIGGQRVKSMSAPGVYIVNGKKVVKK